MGSERWWTRSVPTFEKYLILIDLRQISLDDVEGTRLIVVEGGHFGGHRYFGGGHLVLRMMGWVREKFWKKKKNESQGIAQEKGIRFWVGLWWQQQASEVLNIYILFVPRSRLATFFAVPALIAGPQSREDTGRFGLGWASSAWQDRWRGKSGESRGTRHTGPSSLTQIPPYVTLRPGEAALPQGGAPSLFFSSSTSGWLDVRTQPSSLIGQHLRACTNINIASCRFRPGKIGEKWFHLFSKKKKLSITGKPRFSHWPPQLPQRPCHIAHSKLHQITQQDLTRMGNKFYSKQPLHLLGLFSFPN